MRRLKLLITTFFTAALVVAPAVLGSSAILAQSTGDFTQTQSGLCAGASLDANNIGTTDCTTTGENAGNSVNEIVTLVINIFSWIVGVVAVFAIIIGGFKYITSGGSSEGVTGAKNTILYAIVGLVIVAVAQLVVKFVLGNITTATNAGG